MSNNSFNKRFQGKLSKPGEGGNLYETGTNNVNIDANNSLIYGYKSKYESFNNVCVKNRSNIQIDPKSNLQNMTNPQINEITPS